MLKISEIFYSIQGESSFAGLPCSFVRLAGCNLRCKYCDTPQSFTQGQNLPVEQIIDLISDYGCSLVEITGGEPLIQRETPQLAETLLSKGYKILLETNGTQNIDIIQSDVTRIMDIKTPGSGESEKTEWNNIDRLDRKDEVKFVLTSRSDYDWSKEILQQFRLTKKCAVLFSPAHGMCDPAELARWILEDRLLVRLQLQYHKIIWPNDVKGR